MDRSGWKKGGETGREGEMRENKAGGEGRENKELRQGGKNRRGKGKTRGESNSWRKKRKMEGEGKNLEMW